jgi:hypothetical protein
MTARTERLSPDEAPMEETVPRDAEDRLYHTVIEVIDPDRAAVLARLELPFMGVRVAQGYISRITMDASGHYVTTVHRLRFTR